MDSILWEVFDTYFLEFWFAPPHLWAERFQADMLPYTLRELGVYLALMLVWGLFQFLMFKKCRRRWLRLLPLTSAVAALVLAEILYAVLTGWDALLGHILAFAALYWLIGALLVWGVYALLHRKRAAEPPTAV